MPKLMALTRAEAAQLHARRPATGGNILWPGRRHPDGSYVHVYRKLDVRTPLPMPRVVLQGPRWRGFLIDVPDRHRPRRASSACL